MTLPGEYRADKLQEDEVEECKVRMDHRGTVEWEGKRVVVEGPAEFVSSELQRFRDAALSVAAVVSKATTEVEGRSRPQNEAALIAEKKPADHMEKIAVLAVKLKESGKAEFNGDDMRRSYLRAGLKPPKVMSQALVDTKRHRDFIEPAAIRGMYQLTTHGEDFVRFELPSKNGGGK